MRLIPRETKFFDMFAEIANNVVEGAQVLSDLLHNYDYQQMPASVQKIKEIEHRGDDMTHRILIKLNQTFITPFDREDIHLLASSLDDVLDFVYSASDRLLTYKIDAAFAIGQDTGGNYPQTGRRTEKGSWTAEQGRPPAGALRGSEPAGERSRPGQP